MTGIMTSTTCPPSIKPDKRDKRDDLPEDEPITEAAGKFALPPEYLQILFPFFILQFISFVELLMLQMYEKRIMRKIFHQTKMFFNTMPKASRVH